MYNDIQGRVHSTRCTFEDNFQKHRLVAGRRGLDTDRGISVCFRFQIPATLSEPDRTSL